MFLNYRRYRYEHPNNSYITVLNIRLMADLGAIATIIAATVAATNTAFITIYLTYEKRKSEKTAIQKDLARRYMLQLQVISESLWFRLNNIVNEGGRSILEPFTLKLSNSVDHTSNNNYYMINILYELGSILAYNRIMLLEGIYSQLEDASSTYGNWLKQKLGHIDGRLGRMGPPFYRYHRIALAEALIKRGPDNRLYILTYLEFVKEYLDPNSTIASFLGPAIELVTKVQDSHWTEFMVELSTISSYLQKETNIKSPTDILSYLQKETNIRSQKKNASHSQ